MGGICRILHLTLAVASLTIVESTLRGAESTVSPVEGQRGPSTKSDAAAGRVQKSEAGLPMRLHFDDLEIRKALELFSREGSLNILVSSGVSGRVTANLEGLSFDDALAAILKLCNLAVHRENDLIYVYTQEELAQLQQKSGRVATRVYYLKYLRGTDAEKMITPFLSAESGRIAVTPAAEVGIASQTEQAGGDSLAGGDVLIVQDHESVLQTVDDIIARLDVQPTQVLIEAVIAEVKLEHGTDLGVNFAVLDGAGRVLTSIGSGAELNAIGGFAPSSILAAGNKLPGTSTLGFAPDTHGVKFGFVDKDVTGFMKAIENLGEVRVLASPRIMVLNKQRAELIIGERIGFKTLTVTETHAVEKVEFLNVGTQLRLRPFVGNDGMIRMEIHPERSTGTIEAGLPRTSTSEVTTNVIVPDGSTVVIAGLMQDEDELDQSGVPVLSRLHWIGAAFRHRVHTNTKRELIVLLTPRIWNPACAENSACSLAAKQNSPRLEVQCPGPATAVPGEPCSGKLIVTNVGSQAADEVRVQAVLSQGVDLVPGSPASWSLGTLQPGQSETIDTVFTCSQQGTAIIRFLATGRNNLGGEARQTIRVRLPEPPSDPTDSKVSFMRRLTSRRNGNRATNPAIQSDDEPPVTTSVTTSQPAITDGTVERIIPIAMETPPAPSSNVVIHAGTSQRSDADDVPFNAAMLLPQAIPVTSQCVTMDSVAVVPVIPRANRPPVVRITAARERTSKGGDSQDVSVVPLPSGTKRGGPRVRIVGAQPASTNSQKQ